MKRRLRLGVIAALACTGGCSTFSETHYFKDKANPRNYYRLKITGGAALSSSRYTSGYYDESAVDTYFGEFTQPEKGRFLPGAANADAKSASAEDGSSGVQPLAGGVNLEDRKLLLMLTTNSDAVATGIQSLAQNEALATTLAGIVNRDRITGSRDATSQLASAKIHAKMIADDGTRLVANLPDDASQADAEKNLLTYAKTLSVYLGGPDSFKSLDDAAKWLDANRGRLQRALTKE